MLSTPHDPQPPASCVHYCVNRPRCVEVAKIASHRSPALHGQLRTLHLHFQQNLRIRQLRKLHLHFHQNLRIRQLRKLHLVYKSCIVLL